MNTPKMPFNFHSHHLPERPPRSRFRSASPHPGSLPLNQHPQWIPFVDKCAEKILMRFPEVRPHFLELLDFADLL